MRNECRCRIKTNDSPIYHGIGKNAESLQISAIKRFSRSLLASNIRVTDASFTRASRRHPRFVAISGRKSRERKSRDSRGVNSRSIFPDYTETARRIGFPDSLSREHQSCVSSRFLRYLQTPLHPLILPDRLKRSERLPLWACFPHTFISPVASFALFTLLNYPISIFPLLSSDHHLALLARLFPLKSDVFKGTHNNGTSSTQREVIPHCWMLRCCDVQQNREWERGLKHAGEMCIGETIYFIGALRRIALQV